MSSGAGKRAASAALEAPAAAAKKRREEIQRLNSAPNPALSSPKLATPRQEKLDPNASKEQAKRIFRGAVRVQRLPSGLMPPMASWKENFWQALGVRASSKTSALLDRAAMALAAWVKADTFAHETGDQEERGLRLLSDAVDAIVAVAALHSPHDEEFVRVEETLIALDRQLVLQNTSVDFGVARSRVRHISAAYSALLSQVTSIDAERQGGKCPTTSMLTAATRGVENMLASSNEKLLDAGDKLTSARQLCFDREAAVSALEGERANAAGKEFDVPEEHAKAIARVDVRHSASGTVAVGLQLALKAAKAAVRRRKLELVAAREACAFACITSMLLTAVKRQWVDREKEMRELASSFVYKNFPALCEALDSFFTKSLELFRETTAEVVRLEEKRSRRTALNMLKMPSEELVAIQHDEERELERCKLDGDLLHQSLVDEARGQQELWARSRQVLPPEGALYVAQQYQQLFHRCDGAIVDKWLKGLAEDVEVALQVSRSETTATANSAKVGAGACMMM